MPHAKPPGPLARARFISLRDQWELNLETALDLTTLFEVIFVDNFASTIGLVHDLPPSRGKEAQPPPPRRCKPFSYLPNCFP